MRIRHAGLLLSLLCAGCAAPSAVEAPPAQTFAVLPGNGRWPTARTHDLARRVTQALQDRGASVVPSPHVLATYPARLVKLDADWVAQLDVIDQVVKVTVLKRERRSDQEIRLDITGWESIPRTDDLPALADRLANTIEALTRHPIR